MEKINLEVENVINFPYEITFRLNYEKSLIKDQLVLAVIEKIKSCGRGWGNDLVVVTSFWQEPRLNDCGMESKKGPCVLGINQIYFQNIHSCNCHNMHKLQKFEKFWE